MAVEVVVDDHGVMGGGAVHRWFDRFREGGRVGTQAGPPAVSAGPVAAFRNQWHELHPLNVPGPFYGGGTDTCCEGPPIAPASLLFDHCGLGFVWRQPRNHLELRDIETAAEVEVFGGYGCDGDQRWTPELVTQWWERRASHQPLIDLLVSDLAGPNGPGLGWAPGPVDEQAFLSNLIEAYLDYRTHQMEIDLQAYVLRLEAM